MGFGCWIGVVLRQRVLLPSYGNIAWVMASRRAVVTSRLFSQATSPRMRARRNLRTASLVALLHLAISCLLSMILHLICPMSPAFGMLARFDARNVTALDISSSCLLLDEGACWWWSLTLKPLLFILSSMVCKTTAVHESGQSLKLTISLTQQHIQETFAHLGGKIKTYVYHAHSFMALGCARQNRKQFHSPGLGDLLVYL